MSWLLITILAYFFAAVTVLFDKYLLSGPIPLPKIYAFYIGILGVVVVFLIPFVSFSLPEPNHYFLIFLAGSFFVLGIFFFAKGLQKFEASRIVPAIGGLTPLFVWLFIFFSGQKNFNLNFLLSFFFLILGSVLITLEREKIITFPSFQLALISAFFFSLSFFLSKIIYNQLNFWSGFISIRIASFLFALTFLFSREVRNEIFQKKETFKKKTGFLFLLGQSIGALSAILQNWAIKLVPFLFLPFVNALEGTKYVFLFFLTIFLSAKFPKILKENLSRVIILQKISAILLIGIGLTILVWQSL